MLLALAGRLSPPARAQVLSQVLSRWRQVLPLRLVVLAQRRAGVTPHMLQLWSEGDRRPSFPQVLRFCRALEISVADLLFSDGATIQRHLAAMAQQFERQRGAGRTSSASLALRADK